MGESQSKDNSKKQNTETEKDQGTKDSTKLLSLKPVQIFDTEEEKEKALLIAKEVGLFVLKATAITGVALGGVAIAVPALGFTAGGVAAGSAAAAYQSAVLGGTIASGSIFATLQSVGAAGLALSTQLGICAGSAGVAGAHSVFKVVKKIKKEKDSDKKKKKGENGNDSEDDDGDVSENDEVTGPLKNYMKLSHDVKYIVSEEKVIF
ncbi:hypothetical protein CDAR_455001 [Caerostris darwini]|uniref:Uncharacterized protein n=1 Tax=Caerostris darwini TaxID=1538125 RepID=A0AAV4P2J4_9ARAC|nr:hypothetical protein CDAR_455001 [Caerostris darwini]